MTAYTAILPELRRLRRENKKLRKALAGVLPYAETEAVQLQENVDNGEEGWEREASRAARAVSKAQKALEP